MLGGTEDVMKGNEVLERDEEGGHGVQDAARIEDVDLAKKYPEHRQLEERSPQKECEKEEEIAETRVEKGIS